mmetsp:Transcript_1814/g.7521  ORF Transcript_1814/g.7521 Transcript_1814/m.7521 type:complete len:238 (+) Transcript_1814:255-968(+)
MMNGPRRRRTRRSAPRRVEDWSSSRLSARPPSRTRRRTPRRPTWTRTTTWRTRRWRTRRGACVSWRGSRRTKRPATGCSPSARSRRRSGACPRRRSARISRRTRSCGERRRLAVRLPRTAKKRQKTSRSSGSCRSTTTKARFSRKPRTTPSARLRRTRFTRAISRPPPAATRAWTRALCRRRCRCAATSSARWVRPSGRTSRTRTPAAWRVSARRIGKRGRSRASTSRRRGGRDEDR